MDDVLPVCVCLSVRPVGPVGFSLSRLELLYLKFQGGIKRFHPETCLHLELDCCYVHDSLQMEGMEFRNPQSYLGKNTFLS